MTDGVSKYIGGYGGYSVGVLNLTNEILFVNVGGEGNSAQDVETGASGGYNGGGAGGNDSNYNSSGGNEPGAGGGGATHVATASGLLSSLSNRSQILIVSGGVGGGVEGHYGYNSSTVVGNQTSGYAFGTGGTGANNNGGGGGGGGFYGGGGQNSSYSGGGGSGYIGNSLLTEKYMYCYNCETSDVESTKTYTTTCAEETPMENCAKKRNGYARITYLHS